MTRFCDKRHFCRAVLEATAFQTFDVFQAMQQDSKVKLTELRVDGGMAVSNLLMQFQSDLLCAPVVRPRVFETTALGAAYAAGLAVKVWNSTKEISQAWPGVDKIYEPVKDDALHAERIKMWHRAVEKSLNWVVDDAEHDPTNPKSTATQSVSPRRFRVAVTAAALLAVAVIVSVGMAARRR